MDEVICCRATHTEKDDPLLRGVFGIIHHEVVVEPFRVRHPLFDCLVELAYAAMSCLT